MGSFDPEIKTNMTTLGNVFNIDSSTLATDWEDLYVMLDDIKMYVAKTQDFILNADDPGCNWDPPRSPRIGFVSGSGKKWTIRLNKVAKQSNSPPEHWRNLKSMLTSADGRAKLANYLNGNIQK